MQCRRMTGFTLVGFICLLVVVGLLAILAMKVVPTVFEYRAIQNAVSSAAQSASSPKEIQQAFDRQRSAAYIESVSGQDLDITPVSNGFNVHVEYQKIIPLFGPASLLLDYKASNH